MPELRHGQSGFTLIEVLVALVIAAIALAAISRTAIQSTDTATALRDRQLAMWVAQNELTQIRLARVWPELDTTRGTQIMGGKEWQWRQKVKPTPEPWLRRVEIEVAEKLEQTTPVVLVGFVRNPARAN
jgi:general secretion pathway protein I